MKPVRRIEGRSAALRIENLDTDHSSLVELYRKARAVPGINCIRPRAPAWLTICRSN